MDAVVVDMVTPKGKGDHDGRGSPAPSDVSSSVAADTPLDSLDIIDKTIMRSSFKTQQSWLQRMENQVSTPSSAGRVKITPAAFAARMKLRSAIRTVIVANHVNRRRFADGRIRNDVKTGAIKEAQAKGENSHLRWMSFLSSSTQHFLEHTYTGLGRWVYNYHQIAMLFGFFILLSGLPGTFLLTGKASFLWFKVDVDLGAFALISTQPYKDYDSITKKHDGYFHPPRSSLLVLSTKNDAEPVLSYAFMTKALDVVNTIYEDIVYTDNATGLTYGFADLCALSGNATPRATHSAHRRSLAAARPPADISLCASRGADLFSAVDWKQDVLEAVAGPGAGERERGPPPHGWPPHTTDYGPALFAAAQQQSALLYGSFNATGAYHVALQTVDSSTDYRTWRPTTLQIPLSLEYFHDAHMSEMAARWESRVASYLADLPLSYVHNETVRVTCVVESTFEDAMQKSLDALTPWIFVVVAVMIMYSGAFLSTQTRTSQGYATQFSLVVQGSAVSGLAGFSAFGWMAYLGLESINVLCICAVFLVAAVGVDCTFIFVSAMKAAGPDVMLRDAVPMAMAEGASAITMTSLTSIMAFAVSAAASTSQPAFVKFNVTMAIALTLNFLGFILFFAGFQVENEFRILRGHADLAPWRKAKKKKLPEWVDFGNKLRLMITNNYAPNLEDHRSCGKPLACKLAGALVLLASLGVSLGFVGSVGVGMPDEYLVLDSSYLYELSSDFRELTSSNRTMSVSLLVEHLDLMAPAKLAKFVEDVLQPISERDDVYAISCLPPLYAAYLASSAAQGIPPLAWEAWLNSTSDPRSVAARALFGKTYHGEEIGQFSGATVPREIVCTITGVGYSGPLSTSRIEVMNWYLNHSRALNDKYADTCFPCDATRVTFFSHQWAFKTSFDEELPSLCWSTVGLALLVVGAVLLLALPVHRALISVLNIFLVVFAMIGFMGYAGISYNLISYCTLTMAIGFCVDYTVELMHFSVIGEPGDSMGVKFANALRACGYDVLHGCATAFIGVFLLGLSGAMYARLFSYLSMVMCFYGGAYALWCLPSSMTLFDMTIMGAGKKPKAAELSPIMSRSNSEMEAVTSSA